MMGWPDHTFSLDKWGSRGRIEIQLRLILIFRNFIRGSSIDIYNKILSNDDFMHLNLDYSENCLHFKMSQIQIFYSVPMLTLIPLQKKMFGSCLNWSKSDQFRLKFSRSDDTQSFTNALQIEEKEKCFVLIGWTRKTKIKKVKCS